jgi:hypothetical protein
VSVPGKDIDWTPYICRMITKQHDD